MLTISRIVQIVPRMARPIFQCFVAVLLVGLVTSENSSQKNEKTQNIEIEPAMSRLIRPQVEKNLEEASSSRNAVSISSYIKLIWIS